MGKGVGLGGNVVVAAVVMLGLGLPVGAKAQPCAQCEVLGQDIGVWVSPAGRLPATQTISTGGTSNVPINVLATYSAGATVNAYTLVFPTKPPQGSVVQFVTNQTITTLTITVGSGDSINSTITTLAGGTPKSWEYVGTVWWPCLGS